MGWTYGWHSKDELIRHCLTGGGSTVWQDIAHTETGNHLWVVFERRPDAPLSFERKSGELFFYPKRFLGLFLIGCDRRASDFKWGYKDMDETAGPCEVDCPLKYLAMVPDPGGFATEWRAKVQAHHQQKRGKTALLKGIQLGAVLKLVSGCKPSQVIVCSLKPLVGTDADGMRYRVQPRHVESVLSAADGVQ